MAIVFMQLGVCLPSSMQTSCQLLFLLVLITGQWQMEGNGMTRSVACKPDCNYYFVTGTFQM